MKNPKSAVFLLCAALLGSLNFKTRAGDFDGDGQEAREEQSHEPAPPIHASPRHKFMFNTDIRPDLDSITRPALQDLTPPNISINPENIAGISAPPILGAAPVQPMPPALDPAAPSVGDVDVGPPTEAQLHDPHYLLLVLKNMPAMKPSFGEFPDMFRKAPNADTLEKAGQILWEVNVAAFKKALQEKGVIRKIHGKEEVKFTEEDCIQNHDRFNKIFKDTVREDTDARRKRNERETAEWAHLVSLVDSWLEFQMSWTPFAPKENELIQILRQRAKTLIQAIKMRKMDDRLWSYQAWQLLYHHNKFFLQEHAKHKNPNEFLLVWEWPEQLNNAACHAYVQEARNEFPPDSNPSLSANK